MYKVFLEDETNYIGKSYDGSWKYVPSQKILKLEYYYTHCKKLILEGYKEYNHAVEKHSPLNGTPYIAQILIMGRKEVNCDIFIIDLKTRQVLKKETPIGNEYGGQNITGWKEGLLNNPHWDNGHINTFDTDLG